MRKRNVIIGNSAASISAVKSIRSVDKSCQITLISNETYCAYSPALTTYYLAKKINKENMFLADSHFYIRNNVKSYLGYKVVSIEPQEQFVYLANGKKIYYDNLLIATGASPRTVEERCDSNSSNFVTYLRTIEDVEKIEHLCKNAKNIVIVGGGLISLQVANAISRIGLNVVFIISSTHILSQNIDYDSANLIQNQLIQHYPDIEFRFGCDVKKIIKDSSKVVVSLNNGEYFKADIIFVGKGVNPNIQFVQNSGININEGVLVDKYLQTNISNIFASGDVCEMPVLNTSGTGTVPNWINACEQGKIAGLNMAGFKQEYRSNLNRNISNIFGNIIASIGVVSKLESDMEEFKYFDANNLVYRKIVTKDNRIIGAILLNSTSDAGIIVNLCINKTDISKLMPITSNHKFDMSKILALK